MTVRSWLNRNVLGIGLADLAADANYFTFGLACPVGLVGHGCVALALLALLAGAQNPVVSGVEGSLTSSLVEQRRPGTAFGVLNGVNGAADLASSVLAGALWTFVSPLAALGVGAVLSILASAILWTWRGPLSPSSGDRTLASQPSSTA